MSAPEFVPRKAGRSGKAYESPPRRPDSWLAVRPGDLEGRMPTGGPGLGVQGPDQGYALTLARRLRDELVLTTGESADDAIAGCLGVALRRAALFGRAPVIDDLRLAFDLFGFLGEAPQDLIDFRRPRFAEAASSHHYAEVRELALLVPEETLRMTAGQVAARRADWRALLAQT